MIEFKDRKILITGGAGLIGSYLVDQLVDEQAEVTVVDDFSKGKLKNLEKNINNIIIKEGDLENTKFTIEALSNSEIVFHLASRAYGIGYSKNNHLRTLIHNEKITTNLIEALSKTNVKNLLAVSSSCVYSDFGPDLISEKERLIEQPEIANLGYGWAKRFLEQKLCVLANEKKISLNLVRPFNIYGERYAWVGKFSQAIPMLVKKIMDEEDPITVWGSGNQLRTYLHAFDCARIIKEIMRVNYTKGPVNIGLEKTISMRSLTELICKLSNKNLKIENDLTKPEGRFIKSCNTLLLKKILNNVPLETINLEDGIKRMINWYEENFFG